MNGLEAIQLKIQHYMDNYILPVFNPEKIHWVFSLSGGKDSYTMAEGMRSWYESIGLRITATGLFINQWHDSFDKHFEKAFPWLSMEIVDASNETVKLHDDAQYQQAQCRRCSDIRHRVTDEFLKQRKKDGYAYIVCRGLHLSDMAISILWRMLWGLNPISDLRNGRKGLPLVELFDGHYLAKPLCCTREYECEQFAIEKGYYAVHCNCRGLRYPSRRDIIEESARLYYSGDLWEFDVPFTEQYCKEILKLDGTEEIKAISSKGIEGKRALIPDGFFDFAHSHFRSLLHGKIRCDRYSTEKIVSDFFGKSIRSDTITAQDFRSDAPPHLMESDFANRMAATMGPYWIAVCLDEKNRKECFELQKEHLDFTPDISWGQVIKLLSLFYQQ